MFESSKNSGSPFSKSQEPLYISLHGLQNLPLRHPHTIALSNHLPTRPTTVSMMLTTTILRLLSRAHTLSQDLGLNFGTTLMITLVGALFLLSMLITFLVWLRYLVLAGLVVVPVTMVVRWKSERVAEGIDSTVAAVVGEVAEVGLLAQARAGAEALEALVRLIGETENTDPLPIPADPVD